MRVTCLTITQFNRINLLQKSLWSYSQQSVEPQSRELVIVHHDGNECTTAIQHLLSEYNIEGRIFEVASAPLGALRNISIEKATGDLLCQWDDDDFYHPDRLQIQSSLFEKSNCIATTLATQFFWFCDREELYIRRGGKEGIHGSIMFRNHLGLLYDSNMAKGEDTKLIQTLLLQGATSIHCIEDNPQLFVRTYHGLNTWEFEHHFKHTKQALNVEWLLANETKIREWIEVLQIPKVKVRDANEIAFTT
jgi:glycosyltransferase involved in cell wall biosynthesis